jgi:hypothetical protein
MFVQRDAGVCERGTHPRITVPREWPDVRRDVNLFGFPVVRQLHENVFRMPAADDQSAAFAT